MAGPAWQQTAALSRRLASEAHRYPFQQAIRLLQQILRLEAEGPLNEAELDDAIRCRPELSLAFSPADVAAIEQLVDNPKRFQLTLTFLGLYGASSPLPTFYTEDLLDEWREGQALCRHFYDLINHGLYTLFFRGWAKYQLAYQVHENRSQRALALLFDLLGLPGPQWREQLNRPWTLLRHIGLISQHPRSAAGLAALIRDHLASDRVEVRQCVARWVAIPDQQRFLVGIQGCRLGEESMLGQAMEERGSKFRLAISAVNAARFHSLLPDQPAFAELTELVRLYVDRPLVWDLELALPAEAVAPATLGGGNEGTWAQLGWNTWLHIDGAALHPDLASVLLAGPDIGAREADQLNSLFTRAGKPPAGMGAGQASGVGPGNQEIDFVEDTA